MKQFSLILSVLGTANAYFSEYWRNFEQTVAALECEAPVVCGEDVCDVGQACKVLISGEAKCDDVYRYQCRNEDGQRCADDEAETGVAHVLSPLSYCTCVTEAERDAMFCQEAFDMLYNMESTEQGTTEEESSSSSNTDMTSTDQSSTTITEETTTENEGSNQEG